LYFNGIGVQQDLKISFDYFLQSLDVGNSCSKIGMFYFNGWNDEVNFEKAFTEGAKKFDLDSIYHLSLMYLNGIHVEANVPKAMKYLEESSAKNHPDSMYQLAKCLSKGIGLEMNETKALEYYKSAAKLGHLKSQIYLVSKATTKLEKFEYLKMAADGGDPNSQFLIGNLYAKGIGVTQLLDVDAPKMK
jgi:uncharacterized protein